MPRLNVRLAQPPNLWPFVTLLDRFRVEVRGGRVLVDSTGRTPGHTRYQIQLEGVQLPSLSLGKPGP